MNPAGVLAGLDEKPCRDSSVLVLVGRDAELQRIDPMGECCGSLQIGLERGVDATGLVVRLGAGILSKESAGERIAGRTAQPTPSKDIRLGVVEVPTVDQVVQACVIDATGFRR